MADSPSYLLPLRKPHGYRTFTLFECLLPSYNPRTAFMETCTSCKKNETQPIALYYNGCPGAFGRRDLSYQWMWVSCRLAGIASARALQHMGHARCSCQSSLLRLAVIQLSATAPVESDKLELHILQRIERACCISRLWK